MVPKGPVFFSKPNLGDLVLKPLFALKKLVSPSPFFLEHIGKHPCFFLATG